MRFAIKAKNAVGPIGSSADDTRDAIEKAVSYKAGRFTYITITDTATGEIYTEREIFVPNFRLRGASHA